MNHPAHVKEGMASGGSLKPFQYMFKQKKVKLSTNSQNARDLLTTMTYADIHIVIALSVPEQQYNSYFNATIVHVSE